MQLKNKFVNTYIDVQKNDLIAKVPLHIDIDKNEHKELSDDGANYNVTGVLDIINPETGEQWTSPFLFMVQIPKNENINETSDKISIDFEPGDVIMHAEYKQIESDVPAIRNVLENRVPYLRGKPVKQTIAVWKLLKESIGPIPTLYIETILSELYRDPDDTTRPFRLTGEKDYSKAIPVSIYKAVHLRGNIYRTLAHGYAKEGVAKALSSKSKKSGEDVLINVVTSNVNQGAKHEI